MNNFHRSFHSFRGAKWCRIYKTNICGDMKINAEMGKPLKIKCFSSLLQTLEKSYKKIIVYVTNKKIYNTGGIYYGVLHNQVICKCTEAVYIL